LAIYSAVKNSATV